LEDPVDNLKLLQDIFPGKPVVIFTREDSFIWQQKMFRAGASAYLVKTAEKGEIMSVLQRVALGETVYSFRIEKYEIRKSLFSDPYNTSWINSSRQQFLMRPEEDLSIEQVPTKENASLSALYKAFRQIRKLLNPSDTKELMRIFYHGEN
jgi:DNA-binding NarL/FixJ family response regulator